MAVRFECTREGEICSRLISVLRARLRAVVSVKSAFLIIKRFLREAVVCFATWLLHFFVICLCFFFLVYRTCTDYEYYYFCALVLVLRVVQTPNYGAYVELNDGYMQANSILYFVWCLNSDTMGERRNVSINPR